MRVRRHAATPPRRHALHRHHQAHIGRRSNNTLRANIHTGFVTIKPVVEQFSGRLCGCGYRYNALFRTDSITTTEIGTGRVTIETAVHKFGEHSGSLMVKG